MNHFSVLVTLVLPVYSGTLLAVDADLLMKRSNRFFAALESSMPGSRQDTSARISLGRKLFFEKRLSVNDSQACVSCHRLDDGFAGVDNLSLSPGARGEFGSRNSPTVLNAGWQEDLFWDGRAEGLAAQAREPILNPIEMGMPDEGSVIAKLGDSAEYQQAFTAAFPEESPAMSYANLVEAIAAFERTLITPSRFDDFLNGDVEALRPSELKGLNTFLELDCNSCHDGRLLGGETFEPLGKEQPYDNQSDLGLYEITGDESDRMFFKVAPLRNVTLTAPYFHDGRIATLEEAVRQMGRLQLGIELSDRQVLELTQFLASLTDKNREN